MKNQVFIIYFTLLLIYLFPGQMMSQCIVNRFNFGGQGKDVPLSIVKVADGYVIGGYTDSHDGSFNVPRNHGKDAFIAKFDFNNNPVWQHTYGGKEDDEFWSIAVTGDGGFIATGQTASNEFDVSGNHGGKYDVWVVKLDSDGMLKWQHCYGGKGEEFPYEIYIVPEGYTIAAATYSTQNGDVPLNHGGVDAWLLTLSHVGDVLDSRCYGGSGDDHLINISINSNNTLTLIVNSNSNDGQVSGNHGDTDVWVANVPVKSDRIKWQTCLGGSGIDHPEGIAIAPDGDIILTNSGNSNDGDFAGNPAGFSAKLIKMNPVTGVIDWKRSYYLPNSDPATLGVLATSDGGYLSMGMTGIKGVKSSLDGYVIKVDSQGNKKWDKRLGGSKEDNITMWRKGIEINNQYIVLFATNSRDGDVLNPLGGTDAWVVTFGNNCNEK